MTKTKLNKNQTFMGIFTVQSDGKLRVDKAQRLTDINQYKTKWKDIPARKLARGINNSAIVIK